MIKKLSKNIIIYGGTNAIKSLVPVLMLPILTKYLSANDFGILSLVESTILFVTPFILLNINAAINVEYFKVGHQRLKDFITNALVLSFMAFFIIFFLVYLFRASLSSFLEIDSPLFLWIVVFALLRVVGSVVLGIYQSKQKVGHFSAFTLLQTLIDFSLSYLFVVFYAFGYMGRLGGIYIAYFIFFLVGLYLLYKMDYLTKITFKYSKNILHFGIPLIPHAVSGTIIAMSDRYFISYFIGNDQVGYYTIAYQIAALMLLVSISVNQAWSPMLFGLLKKRHIRKAYQITLYLLILFCFVAVSIFMLRDTLFFIFVDEKFYAAKAYFPWLLIGFLFQSFYFLATNFLFFEKRTKLLAMITIIGATINIVLNDILIQSFGVVGVAYATAITWGLLFIGVSIVTMRVLKRFNG
ncbi:MAG: hypothetical protein DSZ09_03675 [Sulfurovum sp.]|nr:MAG: hypothetical protein DSZ09_03675 [Sulfurovum sp.]